MPCTGAPPKPIAFRHFVALAVFAVPRKSVRDSLIQGMAERRFFYAHLSCDVEPPAKLVGTAVALQVEHEATNSAKRLGGKELDFRIGVAQHHRACWVLLETLEINGVGSDGLTPWMRHQCSDHSLSLSVTRLFT